MKKSNYNAYSLCIIQLHIIIPSHYNENDAFVAKTKQMAVTKDYSYRRGDIAVTLSSMSRC